MQGYYYRINDLQEVLPDAVTARDGNDHSSGAYGFEVKTVIRDHDRIYVVCGVPEAVTKHNFPSPKKTARPLSDVQISLQFLPGRAPNEMTADATVGPLTSHLVLAVNERISFLDEGFHGRFEGACVDGYSEGVLLMCNPEY